MNRLVRVVLCVILLASCLLSLSGCKRAQTNSIVRYDGSAVDLLLENRLTLEGLVQLFMDHPEAFLLYDSPYSQHKDFPLWLFDNPDTDRWTCFSTSECDFILNCKSSLLIEYITLYEARTNTYTVLELHFDVASAPYTIYWIDADEDGFDEEKLRQTMDWLLRARANDCYIEKVLGNNWYALKWDEQ